MTNNSKSLIIRKSGHVISNPFSKLTKINDLVSQIQPDDELYIVYNSLIESNDFGSIENNYSANFNKWVIKFYSQEKTFQKAVKNYLIQVQNVLNNDVLTIKLIIEDIMIFETFFLVQKEESFFYGFMDNENAHLPQMCFSIKTKNLYKYIDIVLNILEFEDLNH
jgi:hypothetical protein